MSVQEMESEEAPDAMREVYDYTVGLIGLSGPTSDVCMELLGSGTLVRTKDCYGILTASHVLRSRAYGRSEHLGIPIVARTAHRFSIPKSQLSPIIIGSSENEESGPDLAVLQLLNHKDVEEIEAHKSFWGLDAHRVAVLGTSRVPDSRLCILAGCVGAWTQQRLPDNNFENLKRFKAIFLDGIIEAPFTREGFDYVDFPVDYKAGVYTGRDDIPSTFGGVSGGGLWRLTPKRDERGVTYGDDPVLIGVAFYETPVVDQKRTILCHYAASVYDCVLAALESGKTVQ